ncbi:MAG: NAD-dependent epimerase/dehydratase family protein [Rubripirellula sp.]
MAPTNFSDLVDTMLPENRRRIVVLGAAGFLGSSMVRFLAAAGHDVVAYWRQAQPEIAKLENVTSFVGDLRDTWTLAEAFQDADLVYHFASSTYPSLFYADPSAEYSEALQPLLVMMETAQQQGVRKIVYPSSGGTIYADSPLARTEDSPVDPRSPYAVFKLAAEQLLHHAARQNHFCVDVFRVGNPYGPGQRTRPGQGVLPHWIDALHNASPIRIFGDGSACRDYVYVEDACRLMAIACDRLEESGTFNLGTGDATSLTELVTIIEGLIHYPPEVEYLPGRASDIASISLCPTKVLAEIDDFQFTSLNDGLRKTLQHHQLIDS